MAQTFRIPIKHPARILALSLALLLLLLVGGAHSGSQLASAHTQMLGIPVSEPAPEPAGRVSAVTPDPVIQGIIDQVSSEVISNYDRQLAGELPVWVDGGWYTIPTRYTYSGTPIQKTTSFVGQHMAGLGLDVDYHVWDAATDPNVIGEIPGMTQPERIVIIGAHIDDVSGAPGADDNASGSVATLIAADIFSQYNWDCTLRFAFWTGEEQGLLGSYEYALRAHQLGENIEGYLNLDMIAYNTIGSARGIDVIYNPNMPPTHDMALLFSDVVSAYGIDLIPDLRTSLGGGSDHQSFWDQGYTSILTIEDQNDFNPYYHGSGDTPAHTDLGYFTDFTKASLATFAHMGCLLPPSSHLTGTVANSGGTPIPNAHVQAQRSPTQEWETVSNLFGVYNMDLVGGVYTVTAQAPGYMNYLASGIILSDDMTTTLDITMLVTPTYVLTGYVRDELSGEPLSATVSALDSAVAPVQTDPVTGLYSIALMRGSYSMMAESPYHQTKIVPVDLQANQQQDFDLASYCLLVVSDDKKYGDFYTDSLDRLGYLYQYQEQAPDLSAMSYFQGVVWFTGDQVTETLTQSDQDALAAYLDGGGRLFVSGQNIGQDIGASSFFKNYLHASFATPDAGLFTLNGLGIFDPLVDIFIQGGNGANNQDSPDAVNPAQGGEAIYRYWSNPLPEPALYGGTAFSGTHRTVYLSFGFEAINRSSDRDGLLHTALNYLGTCIPPEAPRAAFSASDKGRGSFQFTNTSQGTPVMSYTWDFGDGSPLSSQVAPAHIYAHPGYFTVTLTVSSRYGQDTVSLVVFVPDEVFLPSIRN